MMTSKEIRQSFIDFFVSKERKKQITEQNKACHKSNPSTPQTQREYAPVSIVAVSPEVISFNILFSRRFLLIINMIMIWMEKKIIIC